MKLISYSHVNHDLRNSLRTSRRNISESSKELSVLANTAAILDVQDLEQPYLHYPNNVSMQNLLFFTVGKFFTLMIMMMMIMMMMMILI